MVKARGYAGGPDHFRRVVGRHRPRKPAEAFQCLKTLPGEQAQVIGRTLEKSLSGVSPSLVPPGSTKSKAFFGILAKQSLRATDFLRKKQLRDHIASCITSWNREPTPFIWTKPAAAIIRSHRRMLAPIS